jgi:hypothetical protein
MESIKYSLRSLLLEHSGEIWYHGTPDVREIEKEGGFTQRTNSVEYVADPDKYNEIQNKLRQARTNGDDDLYHALIKMVPELKVRYTINKPIFLTNKLNVANTYADPQRAYDYQNAVEKVLRVSVNTNKGLVVNAPGDRFRFIGVDKVKRGFMNAGVDEEVFDKVHKQFNFVSLDKGIKTDVLGAMAQFLGFDYVDVIGVLDSYNGGSIRSTVRMVFNSADLSVIPQISR